MSPWLALPLVVMAFVQWGFACVLRKKQGEKTVERMLWISGCVALLLGLSLCAVMAGLWR